MKRWMRRCLMGVSVLVMIGIGVSGYSQGGGGYQGINVVNGGTLVGEVKLAGAVPASPKIPVTKDNAVCGKEKTSEALIVSSDKGIKNAVVSITNIKQGKKMEPPATNPQIDQKGCWFNPHVLLVPAGSTIDILNNDGILHNLHTMGLGNPSINKAQPKFMKKITAQFKLPEVIKVQCDVHSWMGGWIVVQANPYYALTDGKGSFKIADVPAGTYQLQAWQESLGNQTKEVTVKAGAETKVTFEFKGK